MALTTLAIVTFVTFTVRIALFEYREQYRQKHWR